MEYKDILVSAEEPIGFITLNSPNTANALSINMIKELIAGFEGFRDQPVKVIILKSAGRHFCSGHNIAEMIGGGMVEEKFIMDQCAALMNLMHDIPQVVIAEVHGVATAAGCQLVATADMAVAEEKARFATPGVKIGLFCTTPMVALTRAVGRKRAMEMLMNARMISAEEAMRWGLINRVVPEDELEAATLELARSVAESSPLVLALGKQTFYRQIEQDERRAYELAKGVMTMNLMAEDAQEGMKAFLEKRKPTWTGR
jgi:enoyl-CoA hydratase/carnithine racemase